MRKYQKILFFIIIIFIAFLSIQKQNDEYYIKYKSEHKPTVDSVMNIIYNSLENKNNIVVIYNLDHCIIQYKEILKISYFLRRLCNKNIEIVFTNKQQISDISGIEIAPSLAISVENNNIKHTDVEMLYFHSNNKTPPFWRISIKSHGVDIVIKDLEAVKLFNSVNKLRCNKMI